MSLHFRETRGRYREERSCRDTAAHQTDRQFDDRDRIDFSETYPFSSASGCKPAKASPVETQVPPSSPRSPPSGGRAHCRSCCCRISQKTILKIRDKGLRERCCRPNLNKRIYVNRVLGLAIPRKSGLLVSKIANNAGNRFVNSRAFAPPPLPSLSFFSH